MISTTTIKLNLKLIKFMSYSPKSALTTPTLSDNFKLKSSCNIQNWYIFSDVLTINMINEVAFPRAKLLVRELIAYWSIPRPLKKLLYPPGYIIIAFISQILIVWWVRWKYQMLQNSIAWILNDVKCEQTVKPVAELLCINSLFCVHVCMNYDFK